MIFDADNFVLQRLLKEMQGPPEIMALSHSTSLSQKFIESLKNYDSYVESIWLTYALVKKVLGLLTQGIEWRMKPTKGYNTKISNKKTSLVRYRCRN